MDEAIMTDIWLSAALWVGLALVATLISIWFRIVAAWSEIVVDAVAQRVASVIRPLEPSEAAETAALRKSARQCHGKVLVRLGGDGAGRGRSLRSRA